MASYNKSAVDSRKTTNISGHAAYRLDDKVKLATMALTTMLGEPKYYGDNTDELVKLAERVAGQDGEFVAKLAVWARCEGNMRSVSHALLAVVSHVDHGTEYVRKAVRRVASQRGDDGVETLATCKALYGKPFPHAVIRGVGDALGNMSPNAVGKYRLNEKAFKLRDALRVTHPVPKNGRLSDAFEGLLDGDLKATDGWKTAIQGGHNDAETWDALMAKGELGYMACLDENEEVWHADGSSETIASIVARRGTVASVSKIPDVYDIVSPSDPAFGDYLRRRRGNEPSTEFGDIVEVEPIDFIDAGMREMFDVTVSSGITIRTTADHKWLVKRPGNPLAFEWVETASLIEKDSRIVVPTMEYAHGTYGTRDLGYLVGVLLGDGCMRNCRTPEFAATPGYSGMIAEEVARIVDKLFEGKCAVHQVANTRKYRIVGVKEPGKRRVNHCTRLLEELGIWGDIYYEKHVPKRNYSREFKCGLIAGLVDTDGCVRMTTNDKGLKFGEVSFASQSEQLVKDFMDICLQLGIYVVIKKREKRRKNERDGLWVASITTYDGIRKFDECATLHSRKRDKLAEVIKTIGDTNGNGLANVRFDKVKSVVPCGVGHAYCVTVDKTHCFIANGVLTGNCLRNLRSIIRSGSDVDRALALIADPDEVRHSRQLPFRFWTTYKTLKDEELLSTKVSRALDSALVASCDNVERLPGRTAVLIDSSGSMSYGVSAKSDSTCFEVAALLGAMFTHISDDAWVAVFSTRAEKVDLMGTSVLADMAAIPFHYGGTDMAAGFDLLCRSGFDADRVVVLSDNEVNGGGGWWRVSGTKAVQSGLDEYRRVVGHDVWCHAIDLQGYGTAQFIGPKVNVMAGWSDKVLGFVSRVENGSSFVEEIEAITL